MKFISEEYMPYALLVYKSNYHNDILLPGNAAINIQISFLSM